MQQAMLLTLYNVQCTMCNVHKILHPGFQTLHSVSSVLQKMYSVLFALGLGGKGRSAATCNKQQAAQFYTTQNNTTQHATSKTILLTLLVVHTA